MYFPLKYSSKMEELIPETLMSAFEDDDIYKFMFSEAFRNKSCTVGLGVYSELNQLMLSDYIMENEEMSFIKKDMSIERRNTEWREYFSMLRTSHKWNQNKIVYQIDSTFEKELLKTEKPKVPYSILENLPYDCFYIEFGAGTLFKQYIGFFVNIVKVSENRLSIAINRITPDEVCYHSFIITGENANGFGVTDIYENDKKYFTFDESKLNLDGIYEEAKPFNTNIREENIFIMQFILYLCSDKNDVKLSEESQKTYREPKVIKNKYSEIRKFEVGFQLGQLFREYKKQRKNDYIHETNGSSKKPHIRRAHWSTYYVGKGRTKTVLRWINQLIVHENLLENE